MRAWIFEDKRWGELGERRWAVEWYEVTPKVLARIAADPDHEIDFDSELASMVLPCKTRALAMTRARAVLGSGKSFFGAVQVQEQVVDWMCQEDRVGTWEN